MQANEWRLLDRCIEDGISRGIRRFWKYRDTSSDLSEEEQERLAEMIGEGVSAEISEWFVFPDPYSTKETM